MITSLRELFLKNNLFLGIVKYCFSSFKIICFKVKCLWKLVSSCIIFWLLLKKRVMLNLDTSIFNQYYQVLHGLAYALATVVFVKWVELSYLSEMFHLHMGQKHGNKGVLLNLETIHARVCACFIAYIYLIDLFTLLDMSALGVWVFSVQLRDY